MAKTIIQTIGPLYGEVVNGTVFGRPNGSVYVPSSNRISVTISATNAYVRKITYSVGDRYIVCDSSGNSGSFTIVAESQDTQSYIATYLEDENGVQYGNQRVNASGLFNITGNLFGAPTESTPDLVQGDTYYFVAVLYSANGVPIATDKKAVSGVVI